MKQTTELSFYRWMFKTRSGARRFCKAWGIGNKFISKTSVDLKVDMSLIDSNDDVRIRRSRSLFEQMKVTKGWLVLVPHGALDVNHILNVLGSHTYYRYNKDMISRIAQDNNNDLILTSTMNGVTSILDNINAKEDTVKYTRLTCTVFYMLYTLPIEKESEVIKELNKPVVTSVGVKPKPVVSKIGYKDPVLSRGVFIINPVFECKQPFVEPVRVSIHDGTQLTHYTVINAIAGVNYYILCKTSTGKIVPQILDDNDAKYFTKEHRIAESSKVMQLLSNAEQCYINKKAELVDKVNKHKKQLALLEEECDMAGTNQSLLSRLITA